MPGNTIILSVCPLDGTLQLAVGEGVVVVEVQIALVAEEALPGLRVNAFNATG